jgi:hypothetical protein
MKNFMGCPSGSPLLGGSIGSADGTEKELERGCEVTVLEATRLRTDADCLT